LAFHNILTSLPVADSQTHQGVMFLPMDLSSHLRHSDLLLKWPLILLPELQVNMFNFLFLFKRFQSQIG
jgi:hypothetical protein